MKAWFVFLPLVAACAPPKAPLVPLIQGTPMNPAFYDRYRLAGDVGFFSAKWKRADGEYNWVQLDEMAAQFPESADVYRRANARSTVLVIISGTGGAIVGFTLGWNIGANDDTRWSSGTQVALYSVGGGLIVTALIMGLAWHNPAEDFADVYNASLRRHLGLPEPSLPKKQIRNPGMPERPGTSGFGWRF
jgi:hypothetical protein